MPPASRSRRVGAVVAPALAVLCVVGLDALTATRDWPLWVIGLLDEPAHLLTAWLVLQAIARTRRRYWPGALLGAVAIDVDHVPLFLWDGLVADGGSRPVTHSLMTVLGLLAAAIVVRPARVALGGLAAGVLLHFLRDVATGPGLPLLWPMRPTFVLLPYWVYLLALVGMAGLPLLLAAKHAPSPPGTADSPPASAR